MKKMFSQISAGLLTGRSRMKEHFVSLVLSRIERAG